MQLGLCVPRHASMKLVSLVHPSDPRADSKTSCLPRWPSDRACTQLCAKPSDAGQLPKHFRAPHAVIGRKIESDRQACAEPGDAGQLLGWGRSHLQLAVQSGHAGP